MLQNLSRVTLLLLVAVLAARPLLASSKDAISQDWDEAIHNPQRIIAPSDSSPLSLRLSGGEANLLPLPWRHGTKQLPKCQPHSHPFYQVSENWRLYSNHCETGDLRDLRDQYIIHDELGSGASGRTWKARDLRANPTDKFVAIKCSHNILETLVEKDHLRDASSSHHPNIARYISSFGFVQFHNPSDAKTGRPVACIVQEFIKGTTLQDALVDMVKRDPDNAMVDDDFVRRMFHQAVLALKHIHGMGMVHRDIKLNNFVLEKATRRLVLIDFDRATYVGDHFDFNKQPPAAVNHFSFRRSPEQFYIPGYDPELTQNKSNIDWFAVDRYALGTLLRGMFTVETTRVVGWREQLQGPESIAMDKWAKKLFGNLKAWDLYRATRGPPATRITLDGMLRHEFMTQKPLPVSPGQLIGHSKPFGDVARKHNPRKVQQAEAFTVGSYADRPRAQVNFPNQPVAVPGIDEPSRELKRVRERELKARPLKRYKAVTAASPPTFAF